MRKLRQKKEPFRVILNDLMSWRPDWVAGDPVSTNKQTQQHQQRPSLRSSVGWLPQETAMLLCMQTDSIYQGLLCCVDLPRMKQGMKLQPCTRGAVAKGGWGQTGIGCSYSPWCPWHGWDLDRDHLAQNLVLDRSTMWPPGKSVRSYTHSR